MTGIWAGPPAAQALLHCDAIATAAPESDREHSASYEPDNFFDRHSRRSTLEVNYRHMMAREQSIRSRRLALDGGDVLSVGAGWHPGRHLFPAPAFRIVAVDADADRAADLATTGRADEVLVGSAGRLGLAPRTFDVVLYRLVLHHIAYQGPLAPCFEEAANLLRPGGALIAIEPGLWHPIGAALSLANRTGAATALHGTPDDVPLSPRLLRRLARQAGLEPELHAVTYGWRRLPPALQRGLQPLDEIGSRPRAASFGHTLMLIARHGG